MKLMIKKEARGQSMFELIFAIAIATLILTGIVSLAAVSVRNSTASRDNALANRFAQEVTEWLRRERDNNWTVFITNINGSATQTYCFDDSPALDWGKPNPCSAADKITANWIYTRETSFNCFKTNVAAPPPVFLSVLCTDPDVDLVEVVTKVKWADPQGSHTVTHTTQLTNWKN